MTIEISVSPSEMLQYAMWGAMRNIQSAKLAADKHGACTEKDGWQINIMAVIAEAAWAKYRNVYYNASMKEYTAKDVDGYYELRSSSLAYSSNACLRIHKEDCNESPYILALVGMMKVVFVGWIYGSEGKQKKYWGDRWKVGRPAYFVEQSDLRPMDSIPLTRAAA